MDHSEKLKRDWALAARLRRIAKAIEAGEDPRALLDPKGLQETADRLIELRGMIDVPTEEKLQVLRSVVANRAYDESARAGAEHTDPRLGPNPDTED